MHSEKSRHLTESVQFGWKFPYTLAMPEAGTWLDACRRQHDAALQIGDAMLAGLERMQEAQLAVLKEWQAQSRQSGDALAGVSDLGALMSAQGALASAQCQSLMRQMSGMAEIVQTTQAECMRAFQAASSTQGDGAAALPYAGMEMPAAWKAAMEAARESGETMMKVFSG